MNENSKATKLDLASWGAFMVLSASAVIVAICLPEISKTFSTNLSEGGALETARSFVILILLLLAGMLAQRWGKKRLLTLGQYLIVAGLFLASLSQNYAMLILAVMLMGAGGGFSEALLNPLIVDIHPRESGTYLNLGHAFYPVGIVTVALIIGELLTRGYSWRLMFQIAGLAALVVAIIFTVLPFPPEKKDNTSYPRLFASILKLAAFWLFAAAIFLGASIESAFTFWSRSYVEVYLSEVPRSGALAVVIFAGSLAAGRFLAAYLANKISLNGIMLGSAILGVCVSAMISFATSLYWFYGLLALAGLATACYWPTIMAEAEALLDVNSTILFVLLACAGIVGFGLTPWILGLIGDNADLRSGFAIIPLLFVGLIATLVAERRFKKLHDQSELQKQSPKI